MRNNLMQKPNFGMASCTTTIPTALMVAALLAGCTTEAFIGMNWGRQSAQRLLPSQVVDLMLQNGIRNARVYTSQEDILKAFVGTGINLTVSYFDSNFNAFGGAGKWFSSKSTLMLDANVRTVLIGAPYIFTPNPNLHKLDEALKLFRRTQNVFDRTGNEHIKANTPHCSAVLTVARRPSDSEFVAEIKDKMMEFLNFLRIHSSPFLVDMIPILDVKRCNLSADFALPTNDTSLIIRDVNGAVYNNAFEWQYDCFAWALLKLNASDIKIVVSQVGWPTDGLVGANSDNAARFFNYLLPLVSSNKGTPMRPGVPIDIYVHALTDEPKMVASSPMTRHWGIYRSNGQPKYKVDLSGQGRDIFPIVMKGIMAMPKRWCLFNGNTTDMAKVNQQVARACKEGDCTTLAPGSSCSHLNFISNVSYAFNIYFQTRFQDERACDFAGLGYISEEDPSRECLFPVEVVKGRQLIDLKWASGASRGRLFDLLLLFSMLVLAMWS